jgi:hypothetical protein
MTPPKLFISYSWSTDDHQKWVLDLATELRESGVDVILDKWDLKEGHDAHAFMEKMATDPEIKKVAIICDEKYAVKADGRSGGVGTETQIISPGMYENQTQDKFVAIVSEKDESGKPYLPTYYKSRIFIDLSEADRYADDFEKLLRWIFDKPLYIKPELGSKPSFLSEGEHVSLGTTAIFKKCIDALRNHKTFAPGVFDEYCTIFTSNMQRIRLSNVEGEFDDAVIKNIGEFLPYRNEAIQLFTTIAQYFPTPEIIQRLHSFFERLIPYTDHQKELSQWQDWDFDNFRFIVHELFLYALAILVKYECFNQANYLLKQPFYVPDNPLCGREAINSFEVFRKPMKSLKYRNDRLKLDRLSVRADLLKERSSGTGLDFRYLMQADFVAFMRTEIDPTAKSGWWPETLVWIDSFNHPFEIFARSISKTYFDKVKSLLTIQEPQDLAGLFKSYNDGSRRLPRWEWHGLNPGVLLGYEMLATRP